jgi:hypothetical protein
MSPVFTTAICAVVIAFEAAWLLNTRQEIAAEAFKKHATRPPDPGHTLIQMRQAGAPLALTLIITALLLGLGAPARAGGLPLQVLEPEHVASCTKELNSCLFSCRGNIRKDCELCRITNSQCTGESLRAWTRTQEEALDDEKL